MAIPAKKVASLFIPAHMMQEVKKKLLKSAFPIEQNKRVQTHIEAKGMNLVGYARAEMGIGESCRIAARSLSAADIPFGIINFTGTNDARMSDHSWAHKEVKEPLYDVNVFHINAEQMLEIYAHYGSSIFNKRYNIGYWHWELPDFPEKWVENFNFVDEIWVPSNFVAKAISLKSPVPVVRIPHGIEVKIEQPRSRSYFKLPEANTFLFLTMYDVKSYQERKNPQASIEAFKQAFEKDDMTVGLIVKVNINHAELKEMKQLEEIIGDYRNIYLIKEVLSRNDVNALLVTSDCYISLHRSEGFGLGLAEAMYLGKPAIGTNWSSNTDFMNHNNSCPVNYELVSLGSTYGPYEAYQIWAEPDVSHASYYMKRLVEDTDYRNKISKNGEQTIKLEFSPQKVGHLVKKRLEYIKIWNAGG
ncbi:glycosyltransferase family 4 protein [Paenibacillus arenilitoris]|uniref:Glycosyltransferase n=1 Tax=Paenibacillus arenilitoris TaxID=2772299 RepID=A0A927CIZ3_9BACL|nr:glycosyltransferase [Paenibacillus arenilitoris]MBD2867957.1 glycosyltransferase [Paenibacillus arenilitoris]